MNRIKKHPILLTMALLVCLASVAWAGVSRLAYQTTRGDGPTQVFTDVAVATSATWGTPSAARFTRGNPKIALALTGDNADQIQVTCGLYHYNESTSTYLFLGVADVTTVTFSAGTSNNVEKSAGVFVSADRVEFETEGASAFEMRITGNDPQEPVNGWVWGFGAEPDLPAVP